jgi:hypothetical protein
VKTNAPPRQATGGTTGSSVCGVPRPSRERNPVGRRSSASAGADRITTDWKITFGTELDHETEQFDLDEDEPVHVERREREFRSLVVRSPGEHWSVGAGTEIGSSTFTNMRFFIETAPAIEFNVFPYSQYTRWQLRVQ